MTITSPTASSVIGAQLAFSSCARDRDRRGVEQRREEDEEHDVRVELRRRQARHEADDQPAEHERDRIRDAAAQAEPRQHGDGEQQEDEQLDLGHGIIYSLCRQSTPEDCAARCRWSRRVRRWRSLAPAETLVVLATDPEAPIDLAALALTPAAGSLRSGWVQGWRLTL